MYRKYCAESDIKQCDGSSGIPGKSQNESQENQEKLEEPGRAPLAALRFPDPPCLSSCSSKGSLSIDPIALR